MAVRDSCSLVDPSRWGASLSGRPVLDQRVNGAFPVAIRRWNGIAPEIDQAALNQHFVSIHLGGAKRLSRMGDGHAHNCDVTSIAHSVVPAGSAFQWNTEGPVDFAHFYFDTRHVDEIIQQGFDRDPAQVTFQDGLGHHDPLVASVALAVIEELAIADPHQTYLDELVHLLLARVLRLHSDVRGSCAQACHRLAPYRLRRALDYIEANLATPIGVSEIAAASGISAYHFSRAFRQTTGQPPYAFLLARRISRAKAMLAEREVSMTDVSKACGFATLSQFSRMFRRETGMTATRFRDTH